MKWLKQLLGIFIKKTDSFRIGDRVFYEHTPYSQKKINHQGHLGVWVISDITDYGYQVNLEGGVYSMFCLTDFDLVPAPDDAKNIPWKIGNVEIVL